MKADTVALLEFIGASKRTLKYCEGLKGSLGIMYNKQNMQEELDKYTKQDSEWGIVPFKSIEGIFKGLY